MTKQLFLLGDVLNGWSLQASIGTQLYFGIAAHRDTLFGYLHWYIPIHLGPLTLLLAWTR